MIAVNSGAVIVAAAGNDYDSAFPGLALDPVYPAQHAIDAAMNGQMIVELRGAAVLTID